MHTLDNLVVIEHCLACERPPVSGLRCLWSGTHPCDMCQGHQGKGITGHWPLMRRQVTSHQDTGSQVLHAVRAHFTYSQGGMKLNKHCEVLVSCSGQKIQKDSKRFKKEQTGTFRNLQELHASYCNCSQATVTACKLL